MSCLKKSTYPQKLSTFGCPFKDLLLKVLRVLGVCNSLKTLKKSPTNDAKMSTNDAKMSTNDAKMSSFIPTMTQKCRV